MLCHLPDRSLLRLSGENVQSFLQGIITNNVTLLETQPALFAALLNPQGKLLHDFFLTHDAEETGAFLLEAHADSMEGLVKLLTMYRLRAKIAFTPLPDWHVYAHMGGEPSSNGEVRFQDPRHPELGERIYASTLLDDTTDDAHAYEAHRLHIGIPDGVRDAVAGRSFPLELGYDKLHAVDFTKGCYVGQEVTARSKFRGTLRKGLYHVHGDAPLPAAGTEIVSSGGTPIGEMRSSYQGIGLVLIRHEDFATVTTQGEALHSESIAITITPLAWMA